MIHQQTTGPVRSDDGTRLVVDHAKLPHRHPFYALKQSFRQEHGAADLCEKGRQDVFPTNSFARTQASRKT